MQSQDKISFVNNWEYPGFKLFADTSTLSVDDPPGSLSKEQKNEIEVLNTKETVHDLHVRWRKNYLIIGN